MFYEGSGKIRSEAYIPDINVPVHSNLYRRRQSDCSKFDNPCYLDDPYEGELFAVMMCFFAPWTDM